MPSKNVVPFEGRDERYKKDFVSEFRKATSRSKTLRTLIDDLTPSIMEQIREAVEDHKLSATSAGNLLIKFMTAANKSDQLRLSLYRLMREDGMLAKDVKITSDMDNKTSAEIRKKAETLLFEAVKQEMALSKEA